MGCEPGSLGIGGVVLFVLLGWMVVVWFFGGIWDAHRTGRVCKACRHHRRGVCHWTSHMGDPLPLLRFCGKWERRFTRP